MSDLPVKRIRFCAGFAGLLGVGFLTACPGNFLPTVSSSGSVTPGSATLPTPRLNEISPGWITEGSTQAVTLTLTGTNFIPNAHVLWGGSTDNGLVQTTYVSDTELLVTVPASYVSLPSKSPISVDVQDKNTSVLYSNAVTFFVLSAKPATDTGRVPSISSVMPTTLLLGGWDENFVLSGTNFNANSTIEVNGTARPTDWVASNALVLETLTHDDTIAAGNLQIVVISDPQVAPSAPLLLPVASQ